MDFLKQAWQDFLYNREVILLLGGLYGLISLILMQPLQNLLEIFYQTGRPEAADLGLSLTNLIFVVIALAGFLLISAALRVVLARILLRGRERALDGGINALWQRSIWVAIRSLSGGLWAVAFMVPALFVWTIATMASGGDTASPLAGLILLPVLIWALVVVSCASAAVNVATLMHSTDRSFNVTKSWAALKGKRTDLAGVILVISVTVGIAMMIFNGILDIFRVPGWSEAWADAVGEVVGAVVSTILGFVLLSATARILDSTAPGLLVEQDFEEVLDEEL
ncbi:MAG: hypothetical protein V3R73_06010 [Sphingomonadales bacterium]